MSLADLAASRGPGRRRWETEAAHDIVRRLGTLYFEETPNRVSRERYLNGDDLVKELSLDPGSEIGVILRSIEEAHATGEISTKEEGVELAREITGEI
jgi:hypothetical protein